MKWRLKVIFFAAIFGCGPVSASDESFLQQPFKSYLFESKNYSDGVRELSRVIQKPVTLPDGVTDFATQINGWNIGFRIPVWMRIGRGSETPTLQDVLDQTSSSMGMGWSYDAAKDRVALDFSWRREDPRTSAELLDVLEHSAPLSFTSETVSSTATSSIYKANPNQTYYWNHHHLDPNDKWRIAFDALLSKPENFHAVWKLRFADDMKRQVWVPQPVINLLSAKITDQAGAEHVIILNDQPCPMNPGEGTITYYVFDLNGKFEQGGVYGSGWRCHDASAWTDPAHKRVTLRVFFNYADKMDQDFLLTKNDLVLQDVSDGQNKMSPSLWTGLHFGDSPFHLTN